MYIRQTDKHLFFNAQQHLSLFFTESLQCWIGFIFLTAYQLLMAYLMSKSDSFVNLFVVIIIIFSIFLFASTDLVIHNYMVSSIPTEH